MTQDSPTQSYLSLHSPRGANAHFALGMNSVGGGFGLQSARAASEDLFIGLRRGTQIICLPFYKNAQSRELSTFLGEQSHPDEFTVSAYSEESIQRTFGWGSDCWEAPGIAFSLYTPVSGIPNPKQHPNKLKNAIAPAIAARLVIDNRDSDEPLQGFFAVSGLRGLRSLAEETDGELTGWAAVQGYGFACDTRTNPNVGAVAHWDLPSLFTPPHPLPFRLGGMGALLVNVPPGEIIKLDFALGWHLNGMVTSGEFSEAYAYTQYFTNLTDVLRYAAANLHNWQKEAKAANHELAESKLNTDQQFMLAQATRSYWACSMLFARQDGGHRWVVNEGSFMMMNTFDLAVDHLFFELRQQPWVVRNVLDSFVDIYSYRDQLHFPGKESTHPGGISFTHDQGAFNTFTPPSYSSYEVSNQPGCYSYMTQEQLINWLVSAGLYVQHTKDLAWAEKNRALLADCLESMLNRDHPDPAQRDGIMDLDSSRTGKSEEITTYDSLDPSLGQARRNLYLAVKGWSAYLALAWLFDQLGDQQRSTIISLQAAEKAAQTITAAFDPGLGYIPALLDGVDQSAIIPAVEGLIFPNQMGLIETISPTGLYAKLIKTLRIHLENVLKPGVCLFPDGSWKLSAHSENSWISKVFLCQHIARKILGVDFGTEQAVQDRAHADWWRVGSPSNPGIDQIFAGKTTEIGFHYPRAITSILWLEE